MQIVCNQELIEKNRELIICKNVQVESQEFKIQEIQQKLKGLELAQALSRRLEQYVKDMEISIRKCEFRL